MEPSSNSPLILLDNVVRKTNTPSKSTARGNVLGRFGVSADLSSHSPAKDSLDIIQRFPGVKRKYFKPNKFGKIRYSGLSTLYLPPRLDDLPPVAIRRFTEQQLALAFTLKDGGFEKKKKKEKKKDPTSQGLSSAPLSTRQPQQLTPGSSAAAPRTGMTPILATPK